MGGVRSSLLRTGIWFFPLLRAVLRLMENGPEGFLDITAPLYPLVGFELVGMAWEAWRTRRGAGLDPWVDPVGRVNSAGSSRNSWAPCKLRLASLLEIRKNSQEDT